MALNVAQKLISSHLLDGTLRQPDGDIALKIDQVLVQDVLGTLVMLELEAMGVERVKVGLAGQYVDPSLVQNDHMNPEEHFHLDSQCRASRLFSNRPSTGFT